MAVAEFDLLENTANAQNLISKFIVIGRSSGFGYGSGFRKKIDELFIGFSKPKNQPLTTKPAAMTKDHDFFHWF